MKKVLKLFFLYVFFILLIGGFTKVFGAEDIQIKITPNNTNLTTSDVMLIIDISSTKVFDSSSNQAVQILIGEESDNNKWVDLGVGKNGIALKKSYSYIVKSNAKVYLRVLEWKKDDRTDMQVLATGNYSVSNIDKTNPIIEKVDIDVKTNSASIAINAKDLESGVSQYTCFCNEISFSKTSESPKFELTNLEPNKMYNIVITVEDKIGNKETISKQIQTKNEVNNNVVADNTNVVVNNTNTDNTIANKNLPEVGAKNFIIILSSITILLIYIIILNRR